MKHFWRSLRYLKPYTGRLTAAVVCVIFVACLWGGGLGMMLPGAKILLAPEGLHGWAWKSLAEDRMKATLVQRFAPEGAKAAGEGLFIVLDVVNIPKKGPSADAALPRNRWIVGLMDGGKATIIRGDVLLRELAQTQEGASRDLAVFDPVSKEITTVRVKMGEATFSSRMLGEVAMRIKEPESLADRFPLFVYLLIAGIIITLLRSVFTFIQEYLVGTAIWRATMDLRCENYNVVLHMPTTFFSEKGVTDATSRFIQDTNELARGQNILMGKTLIEPAKAVASIILAFSLSWELTTLAMLGGPPAFWFIHRVGKKMHKATKRALESWSMMLAVLEETLLGIRVVKAYTMEGAERRRFFRVNRQLLKQQNKMELLDSATGPAVECLGIIAGMAAAGFAGYLVFNGMTLFGQFYQMDSSVFLAWLVALFAMFDPVRKLAKVSIRFQASDAAAARVFELMDSQREPAVPNAPTLPRHSKSIEFRKVSYRYPATTDDTLHEVSLDIRAGQRVAVVGPNGSGKTTLLSLLPRLMDPTGGQILIDGRDITSISVRSLRRQIGLVTQDTVLFHATIGENIAYGLRRPKEADVMAAAKQAFVDDFVKDADRFPEGYQTLVGPHGATLSGGQKQRIAIARAILRNPSILIFDEATSQVDSDSEHRIHLAMEEFMKGRTTLMIAHRFATIMSADMIAVMNNGRVIDTGSHQELMGRCDLYRHLYTTQFGDTTAR